jgi:hypothetical protein
MSPAVARREQPSKHASETGRYHEEGHLSWSDMGDETFVPFPVMRGCRYDASREPRLPGGVRRRFRARRNRMTFMSQSYRAVVGAASARRARRRRTSGRHTPLSCPAAEWRARTGTRRPPPGAPGPTRWASTPPFPTSPSRRPLDGRLDRARDDAADAVVGAADERAHRQQQHADGHRQGDAEHGRPQPASGNPDVAARRQVSGSNPSGYEPGFVSGVPAYANAPPGHCSFTPAP